jgi:hypothetical protein
VLLKPESAKILLMDPGQIPMKAPFRLENSDTRSSALSILISVVVLFFFSPTHHNLSDLPVALPKGEAGKSSAPQCHELRLPGRAEELVYFSRE